MSKKIRWGILGAGKIAQKFANDLKLVQDAELLGIASRDKIKAESFSKIHNIPKIFTTYESMALSTEIDVIYVATPHGLHYEHVMLCLQHRKAVLCEKAFALNSKQVQQMVMFAKKQNVFLMEAIWSRFLPQYEKVWQLIQSGEIGDIKIIQADFGFRAPDPPAQRLFDPVLGGGSLLDIGIYPVFLAQSLLGKPIEILATMTPYASSVDEQCAAILKFSNGALAILSSTFAADTPVEALIAGTKARIYMRNRFHNSIATLQIQSGKDDPRTIDVMREEGYGYQFEARHVNECLHKGLTESPLWTHQQSLDLMQTLDTIRMVAGIKYESDEDLS
jgi:predicted dehydrogenase